jgi:hypothetical protein
VGPATSGLNPDRVSRILRGTLTAPAHVDVVFRDARSGTVLARGAADRPAGPLRLRLMTTKAGRHLARHHVTIRTRAGGERGRVDFYPRLARR